MTVRIEVECLKQRVCRVDHSHLNNGLIREKLNARNFVLFVLFFTSYFSRVCKTVF